MSGISYRDWQDLHDKLDAIIATQVRIEARLAGLTAAEAENVQLKSSIAAAVGRTDAIEQDGRAGLPASG